MEDFGIYIRMGLDHVLDPGAYDHVLFLSVLAAPYLLKDWKKVVLLATVFTVAHCTSLALSAFGLIRIDSRWIEFLIPVTIIATALNNIWEVWKSSGRGYPVVFLGTAVFGLIHGFGFSNYFNMMVTGLEDKLRPLLGFALGIELSQLVVILSVLLLSALFHRFSGVEQKWWIWTVSAVVVIISIPLLLSTLWPLIES